MDKHKETFETWNKVASVYQAKYMDLDLYNETYDFICSSVEKDKAAILEIGCGPGNITRYLLAKRPDFNILCIDFAPNMIDLAKKNNPAASFRVMDCRQISELKTKFDGIVCGFCLPYLSSPESEKLISDAAQLLNKGGLLYLSFMEGDPAKSGFQTASTGDRAYFYYHELDKLKAHLVSSAFKELKVFKVKYQRPGAEMEIHTILTATKK